MLNAAIIGLGRWGRTLVDSVQKDGKPLGDKLRVGALVTRTVSDEVRAYAKAQQLRIASFDEVLGDRSIGAVLIATPHSQHGAQIVAAAKAGKHVFCDKPFTLTRFEAEAGFDACRKAGVVLAAGFNRRFLPATQALRAAIGGGKLGRVLHLEAHFSGSSGPHLPARHVARQRR
jgi:predicted dehydrogenase